MGNCQQLNLETASQIDLAFDFSQSHLMSSFFCWIQVGKKISNSYTVILANCSCQGTSCLSRYLVPTSQDVPSWDSRRCPIKHKISFRALQSRNLNMFWIELYSDCERETEICRLITTTWAIIPKRYTGSKEATFQRIFWAIFYLSDWRQNT